MQGIIIVVDMTRPLARPADKTLLRAFLDNFGITEQIAPEHLLRNVVTAFSSLPYENLTKIIMESEAGRVELARRDPYRVLSDHFEFGSGGTCFSLTATLLHLVRALGFEAEPLLADRHYGTNTHCALMVRIENRPHLIDPGYLILEPIPMLPPETREIVTHFNRISLVPKADGNRIDLFTLRERSSSCRLTYKTSPADAGEFLKAWDESFQWEMMTYPLLTRVQGDAQLYLRGNRMLIRSAKIEKRITVPHACLVDSIARDFGIARPVIVRALSILRLESAGHGQATSR